MTSRSPRAFCLEAASDYLSRGWWVFPTHSRRDRRDGLARCSCGRLPKQEPADDGCPSPAKHPVTKRGLLDATNTPETVKEWWGRWPWANVAIATGAGSGIVVVDVDTDKGGEHSLNQLELEIGMSLRDTLTAHTGSGGLHLVFAHPGSGRTVKTRARAYGQGVDVRGDGGYIVAAPSLHISGNRYAWADPQAPIRPFPQALADKLEARRLDVTAVVVPLRRQSDDGTPYGMTALQGLVDELLATPEGARNDTLNAVTYRAARLVAGGELDAEPTMAAIRDAAAQIGLDDREIKTTMGSAAPAGLSKPKSAPPRQHRTRDQPSTIRAAAAVAEVPVVTHDRQAEPEPEPPAEIRAFDTVDLAALARQGIPEPDLLCEGLVYRGGLHSLAGPPDAGKSTLLYYWALTLLAQGEPVLLLDEESGAEQVTEKFLALHADPSHLEGLAYVQYPGRGWDAADIAGFRQLLEAHRPGLIAFDSAAAFLAIAGRDENAAEDVTFFYRRVLVEVARDAGAAVVILDHIGKDAAGGRYARGSGAKLANVDVAYMLEPVTPFSRAQSGLVKLHVTKDRRGYLHRAHEIRVEVEDGSMGLSISRSDQPDGGELAGLSPAARGVLFALRNAEGPLTIGALGDRVADGGRPLKRPTLSKELNVLADRGLVEALETGDRGAKYWTAVGEQGGDG